MAASNHFYVKTKGRSAVDHRGTLSQREDAQYYGEKNICTLYTTRPKAHR